jgi:3-oxoacyl-[acyl-carrier-protein] synthase-3
MAPRATVEAIEYFLPDAVLTNDELAARFPDWPASKIAAKTGIENRHIAADDQHTSDLAVAAVRRLFDRHSVTPEEVDFILLCTQTPDYLLPTTACLVQHQVGIPQTAGALDVNLGCSGYVYTLSLAKALVESGQANCVLLITSDIYTRTLGQNDFSVRTIFGDGATATLLRSTASEGPSDLGPFVFGTDGGGAKNLILKNGGVRHLADDQPGQCLYMDGPQIFTFTLRVLPDTIDRLLQTAELSLTDIDCFIFHQANQYMLEHLRRKLKIPTEKFVIEMANTGNTVSSSIPIAVKRAYQQHKLKIGDTVMLVGFGVGYSWCAAIARFRGI